MTSRNELIDLLAACAGEDLFDEVGEIVPALPPKQGRLQAPNSRGSTPTLGSIAVPRPPSRKGMEVNEQRERKTDLEISLRLVDCHGRKD